jgi:hypothetical protein
MKTPDQIRDYVASHLHLTNDHIRSNLCRHGVNAAQIAAARAALGTAGTAKPTLLASRQALEARPAKTGKSISDLLEQFDDVAKVQRAMKALPRDSYKEDDEMRRDLTIAHPRWREVREHPAIHQYLYVLPNKRAVWMHPEAQKKLTAAINLSQQ